jgi:hypothetical protein
LGLGEEALAVPILRPQRGGAGEHPLRLVVGAVREKSAALLHEGAELAVPLLLLGFELLAGAFEGAGRVSRRPLAAGRRGRGKKDA